MTKCRKQLASSCSIGTFYIPDISSRYILAVFFYCNTHYVYSIFLPSCDSVTLFDDECQGLKKMAMTLTSYQ